MVSDYEAGQKTWKDEQRILTALAQQDTTLPFEVILVESEEARHCVPPHLYQIHPRVRIVFASSSHSAALKDEGIRNAAGTYTAVLEADCLPDRQWLRTLYEALERHPEMRIASGRTTYGDETSYHRCLSLLDRSFDNPGKAGRTPHVSNNGALYHLDVLKKFPYPPAATPFLSSRLRIKEMASQGFKFYFEPAAVMRHALGGWDFIRDFRRNTGYADMIEKGGRSYWSILKLLWERRKQETADCLRMGPAYLNWYDWPLLAVLWLIVPFLEIPGMLDALRQRSSIPRSSYR